MKEHTRTELEEIARSNALADKRAVLGKAHWSVLLYLETCCVDNEGRMLLHRLSSTDHDRLEQLEDAGLIKNLGTGLQPRAWLTSMGWKIVTQLRKHRATKEVEEAFVPNWTRLFTVHTNHTTLLKEALDSHIYWQLSQMHYRRDGYVVDGPGSDDPEAAKAIAEARALIDVIEEQQKNQ